MRGRLRRLFKRYGKKAWLFIALGLGLIGLLGGGAYAALGGTFRPQSSNDIELQRGLVGWWKLDGNAKDATPYATDGTVTSAALTTDREGRANSAYEFSGNPQNIDIPNAAVLNPSAAMTVSVWFKAGQIQTSLQRIIDNQASSGYSLLITPTGTVDPCGDSNLCFKVRIGSSYQFAAAPISVLDNGKWFHIVGTYDGSAIQLYVNGRLKATTNVSGAITPSTQPLCFGASASVGSCSGNFLLGNSDIDDVRIYNRAISVDEVRALNDSYDQNIQAGSGESGLVGWWKLDGNLKDATPNSNDGTTSTAVVTADRKGRADGAYAVDSGKTPITVANATILHPTAAVTVSAWVMSTVDMENSIAQVIASTKNNGGYALAITGTSFYSGCGAGNLCFYIRGGGVDRAVTAPLSSLGMTSGVWYHVGGSYDGTTMRLYLNGVQVATTPYTGSIDPSTSPFCIAGEAQASDCTGGNKLNGSIDDVRVYSRALSATEVQNIANSYDSQINLNANPTSTTSGGNINQGLVGYWPFSGNAKDATPYGDNGTLENSPTLTTDRFGNVNSAYVFNAASSQDIAIPDSAAISPTAAMSLCAWFSGTVQNTGGTPVGVVIKDIGGSPAQNPIYGFQIVNGSITFVTTTNANVNNGVSHSGLLDNTWYHVCGTSDGTTIRLYLNGATQSSQAQGPPDDSTGPLRIGQQKNGFGRYFTGSVDEVRLYNRALSAVEVQSLYASRN